MYKKTSKLTSKERAEEIISRFNFIDNEEYAIKCALEVAKEAIYLLGKAHDNGSKGRYFYWIEIKKTLEQKL